MILGTFYMCIGSKEKKKMKTDISFFMNCLTLKTNGVILIMDD